MSQAASSQMTQEMSELKEEILFQKVLLQSIDDHVLDREAAEQEVRDEIHSLERRFKQLKRATKASSSSSSSSSKPSSQQFQSTPEQPTNSARRIREHLEMNGYPGKLYIELSLSCASSRNALLRVCLCYHPSLGDPLMKPCLANTS